MCPKGVPAPPAPVQTETKRLNINLSATVFAELQTLSRETHRSMTELVRLALGLVRIVLQESAKGNKLVITTSTGQPLREIVLPG
jgi:hypothetical protein